MSGPGDHPAEHDERVLLNLLPLAEPDRQYERLKYWYHQAKIHQGLGEGVTSPILSASWATSSWTTCACMVVMA
jgi:hypothetical protein